jgi:hypothetical protein
MRMGAHMSEIQRKAKEIIQTSGADTVEHLEKCEGVTHGESFKQRAEVWLLDGDIDSDERIALEDALNALNVLKRGWH